MKLNSILHNSHSKINWKDFECKTKGQQPLSLNASDSVGFSSKLTLNKNVKKEGCKGIAIIILSVLGLFALAKNNTNNQIKDPVSVTEDATDETLSDNENKIPTETVVQPPIFPTPAPTTAPLPVFPAVDFPEDLSGYDKIIDDYFDEIFPKDINQNEKNQIANAEIIEINKELEEANAAKAQADADFEQAKKDFLSSKITEDKLMGFYNKTQTARREANRLNAIAKALDKYITEN